MIAQIQGKIFKKEQDHILLENNGFCYQVFVPQLIMSRIDENIFDGQIRLITYHYHQIDNSKSIPILIGFLNEIEREFFELFITVSGIGPKAALKAINRPISLIAQWINDGNAELMCSLPGIGKQRAKEIIAKLQGKMAKFGLIQDAAGVSKEEKALISKDIEEEVVEILTQLQYKRLEAKEMIRKALLRNSQIKTPVELLNEIYSQKVK